MIINVRKYLIYGIPLEVSSFYKRVQKAGIVEFINPRGKRPKEMPPNMKKVIVAIKELKKEPKKELPEGQVYLPAESVAEKIVQLQERKEQFAEEMRYLKTEIARIIPFGDFSLEDMDYIQKEGNRILQFFCIKTKKKQMKIPEELIYIGTEYDLDYYVAIVKEKVVYPKMIEIIIEKPLGALKERYYFLEYEIKKIEEEITGYAGYLPILHKELVHQVNHYNLENAQKEIQMPMEDHLFSVEAWIPENHIDHFKKIIEPLAVEYVEIAMEKTDRKPTYMENKGFSHMGEDLVKIYDIPSTTDKDPSLWVLGAFAVFFAMITSDAGYGLLYLLMAIFLKWKIPSPKAAMRRFIHLVFVLAISSLIWGGLSGSFFGLGASPNSPMGKATFITFLAKKKAEYHLEKKDDVYQYWAQRFPKIETIHNGTDFLMAATQESKNKLEYQALDTFKRNILMELSLLVGVIHIALSFIRNLRKNWAGFGWIVFMVGGYLYFPSIVNGTSLFFFLGWIATTTAFSIGLPLVYAGIGIAVICALIQKKFQGISEVMNVVQIFADVLSYLRLYALGLAGMIMASTFNDLGAALGFVAGPFVILIGHMINIALAIMGGIIHGLRLNFIEWYHHSFEGNGKLFNPLRIFKS